MNPHPALVQHTAAEEEARLHSVASALFPRMLDQNLETLYQTSQFGPPAAAKVQECVRVTCDAAISAAQCFEARFALRHMIDNDTEAMVVGLKDSDGGQS